MKIGCAHIEVVCGAITAVEAEAVVNPANDMLWTGGGVSAEIRRAGGPGIETEAMKHAPAAIGSAVVTGGAKLRAALVIHAVIAGQDLKTSEYAVRNAVRDALDAAVKKKITSIAIPLVDSAGYDIEIHVAARLIVDETVDFLVERNATLTRVVLVEHEESLRGVFDMALHEKFTRHGR